MNKAYSKIKASQHILFFVLSFCCTGVMSQQKENETQKLLESVSKPHAVTRIEICYFQPSVIPVFSSNETLKKKIIKYCKMYNNQDLQSLFPVLQRIKYEVSNKGGGDMRWKITLYNNLEKTSSVSIYINKFGDRGYIDETPVLFEETPGDLHDWINNNEFFLEWRQNGQMWMPFPPP